MLLPEPIKSVQGWLVLGFFYERKSLFAFIFEKFNISYYAKYLGFYVVLLCDKVYLTVLKMRTLNVGIFIC